MWVVARRLAGCAEALKGVRDLHVREGVPVLNGHQHVVVEQGHEQQVTVGGQEGVEELEGHAAQTHPSEDKATSRLPHGQVPAPLARLALTAGERGTILASGL